MIKLLAAKHGCENGRLLVLYKNAIIVPAPHVFARLAAGNSRSFSEV